MHRGNIRLVLLVISVAVLRQHAAQEILIPETDDKAGDFQRQRPYVDTPTKSKQSVNTNSEKGEKIVNQVESSLLNMFGLKSRPMPYKDRIDIPPHMIELYKQAAGVQEVQLNVNFKSKAVRKHPGNTIRSYFHEGSEGEGSSTPHRTLLHFNLSQIPEEESLKGTELRLYRHRVNDSSTSQGENLTNTSSSITKPHRIDIYDVIKPASSQNEAITRLIDTRLVYPYKSKWESFDIQPAVHRWRKTPGRNHGLEVRYTDTVGNQPELEHVRLRRSIKSTNSDWSAQKPVLLVYSDDGRDAHVRRKRNADNNKNQENRKRKKSKSRDAAKQKKKRKNHCKRHPLFVDFQSVGWTDWIIAPSGYDAFFCHGECPFYMPDHLNATNHAIVQNMVHSFNPQAAPKPCCVPTELSAIAMLYLDDNGKVVLKTYQEMVVDACGCR